MKLIYILLIVICAIGLTFSVECGTRGCPYNYSPVCGRRHKNGKVETTTFPNICSMKAANDCGEGYVPCSEQADFINGMKQTS